MGTYTDYLPADACIGIPAMRTYETVVDGQTFSRKYVSMFEGDGGIYPYESGNCRDGISYSSNRVADSSPEYDDTATYSDGDYVKIDALKLVFRSAADNNTGNHPLENRDKWVQYGTTTDAIIVDASEETRIAQSVAMRLKIPANFYSPSGDARNSSVYIYVGGISAISATVSIVSLNISSGELVVQDSFSIDVRDRNSIFLDVPDQVYDDGTASWGAYVDLTSCLHPGVNVVNDGSVSAAVVSYGLLDSLGCPLYGHSTSRVSEYRTVLSDGIVRTMTTKSYDVFDGHISVDPDRAMRTEYLLARATAGDYVFYTGGKSDKYDQRVYLGRIKYKSPLESSGKRRINISGQSLSYAVENPMIAPDSTTGYPA